MSNVERALEPQIKETLVDKVSKAIWQHIIANGMAPGDQLGAERDLAKVLGVSRSVVREALTSLEGLSIVHKDQGRGLFVRGLQPRILSEWILFWFNQIQLTDQQLVEARQAIELAAVDFVVRDATEDDLQRLDSIVDEMQELVARGQPHSPADLSFHLSLLEASHNPVLSWFGAMLVEFFRVGKIKPYLQYVEDPQVRGVKAVERHRAIVCALQARDIDLARSLIRRHPYGPLGDALDAPSPTALGLPAKSTT